MSKWYNVTVKTIDEYLVEVEDDEDENTALDIVTDELFDFDEVNAESIPEDAVESYKRHADKDKVRSL